MNKLNFYKEVHETLGMIEGILNKFHEDMKEKETDSVIITIYDNHFTVNCGLYLFESNDVLDLFENASIELKIDSILGALGITNKYDHMNWDLYLVALKLGFEKIYNLSKEEVE